MTLSTAMSSQLQRVSDAAGVLVLLILTHPSLATVRVVCDTRDWTVGADTYVGLPFRFRLPQAVQGEAPRAQLEVDNVGRALTQQLDALPPGAALQATIRIVSRAAPATVEMEWTAPMSGVSVTVQTLTATIGNDDALRAPAVRMRYDLTTAPGLFEG